MNIGTAENGFEEEILVNTNDDGSPKTYIKDNKTFIEVIGKVPVSLLFRGQDGDYPLIPKLGRVMKVRNVLTKEKNLIEELKRRGGKISQTNLNDWDLLVFAQHYGLATRLLDWTTNPLVALWLACIDEDNKKNAFVYLLKQSGNNMLNLLNETSPFEIKQTKIFKPNLNNERVIAQNGWFTIHRLKEGHHNFTSLNEEEDFEKDLWKFEIPSAQKGLILLKLNMLGINHEQIYPGVEGTCQFINWANK